MRMDAEKSFRKLDKLPEEGLEGHAIRRRAAPPGQGRPPEPVYSIRACLEACPEHAEGGAEHEFIMGLE
jgi:hypothetical protein